MQFLEARGLTKTYRDAEVPVQVFENLNLGVDRPDSGTIRVQEHDVTAMSNDDLARFRNRNVGFVFQFHHLLPEFTATENVAMPGWIGRFGRGAALKKATELLTELGLEHRSRHFPNQL